MKRFSALRRVLRPRNVAIGLGITVPVFYMIAFAKDEEGDPRPARYWQVKAYEMFPLRAASRLWGRFNDLTLPVWFRPYGFRLYSWLFGVNLSEMSDPDLKNYANLGDFFYRKLSPEARPVADALMVSPCDGKVLQFGQLRENARIEEVKGMSYSVDRFLGDANSSDAKRGSRKDEITLQRQDKFAELNGLEYTLDEIVGGENSNKAVAAPLRSTTVKSGDAADSKRVSLHPQFWLPAVGSSNRLFYCVIYLAPGDYHRFHSPVPWVVTLRRHFAGELFSVAPYFQTRMADLFCLNERVALLGRWKHGFFSMTPVGATNVGSIIINFDKFLKTNQRGTKPNTCYEASYESASPFYKGFPLTVGEEVGGFRLGSTVVLVFEAPENFQFKVNRGNQVKMGQALGDIV